MTGMVHAEILIDAPSAIVREVVSAPFHVQKRESG